MRPLRLNPLNERKLRKRGPRRLRFEPLEAKRLLAADLLFADSFEDGSSSNEWNGKWIESGDDGDWFRSTQRATDGNWSAELDWVRRDLELAQALDLTNYTNVVLEFSWLIEEPARTWDRVTLDLSADNGASWQTVAGLQGDSSSAEDVWHDRAVPIHSNYLTSEFKFRFSGNVGRKQADVNVDNVRLSGVPLSLSIPTISVSNASVTEGDGEVIALTNVAAPGNGGWSVRPGPDFDADGFADQFISVRVRTNNIFRFDPRNAAEPEVFIPEGSGGMISPRAARFGPDGHLYVVDGDADKILRFDGLSGAPLGVDPASPDDATFVHETASNFLGFGDSLVFDTEGSLLLIGTLAVDGMSRTQIVKYQGPLSENPGAFSKVHVPWEIYQALGGNGLEIDSEGNLFVISTVPSNEPDENGIYSVKRFDASGSPYPANGQSGAEFVPSGTVGLYGGRNSRIADPDGRGLDLFVVSENGILRFDGSTGVFKETYIAPVGKAYDIEFLADGTSLVAMPVWGDDEPHGDIVRYGAASNAVFTISLSAPTIDPVMVDVTTVDGSALGGVDYQPVSTTLVFEPGETTKVVIVPTYNDGEIEPTKTYSVELTNIVGADPGDTSGTGEILDDDQPNQSPLAMDDAYSIGQDQPLITTVATGVLANDSDPDGDSLTSVVTSAPSNGQLNLNPDGSFSYEPDAGFLGVDTFKYKVSDGKADPVEASVTITVSEVVTSPMYVGQITLESRNGGRYRAIFEILDGNNQPLAGVAIVVDFAGTTYSGTTDSSGLFKTDWVKLNSGQAYADVVDLALTGFDWDDDADDDEVWLPIP